MALDILVPFWGDPEMLRETVESVLAQTSDDWLLTVVDDAYPDESIAAYFATLTDPRITYVRNEVNKGITENYRTCVRLATQDMMMILGCDDVLLPNYVEVILRAHRDFPHADLIQPGVQVIDEKGAVGQTLVDAVKQKLTMPRASSPRVLSGEPLAASLLRADWLYWPSLAFKRERLLEVDFREGFPIIQDLAIVIDLIGSGSPLLIEPTVCFSYRRHSASASSAKLGDGSRFVGERDYFTFAAAQMQRLGWRRARLAALLHLTSRAHALTLLPKALLERNTAGAKVLAAHAFTNR